MNYYFPLQVRFADTDAQGHAFFGSYFTFFDEAASGLLRALGHSYQTLRAQNLDFVYAHAECDYSAPAVFEDLVHVYARVAQLGNTSVTIECNAVRAADQMLLARGKLVCVIRDATTHQKVPVPESFRRAVQAFDAAPG
ncbi:acyl-CoA thioesterase [Anaerolineae bacterium CFX7]|nr:acyl-CoA thioesterase [Anaerolineae bacterium CFX7]